MIKLKKAIAVLLSVLLLSPFGTMAASAVSKTEFYSQRASEADTLPIQSTHTFSHTNTGSELNVHNSHTVSFRAEKDSIVSILFSNTQEGVKNSEKINFITASVYSDTANKICEAQTDTETEASHIEFVSAYSGVYFLVLDSRAIKEGQYSCSYSISAATDYEKNEISSFPHTNSYTENNHQAYTLSELFSNEKYQNADSYRVSVFEMPCEAGTVFSYKLNTGENALTPYAVLMSYDGEVYTPHVSHAGQGYLCGDAIELSYSAKTYLFVFSDGNFTLEADTLLHNEYKITELGSAFSGHLDTSLSALMYDDEKISQIKKDFPFSDIKNRNVIFFAFDNEASSAVSFICDRSEHKFLSLVSDINGLSHSSVYPMREFNKYCSEISPCEYCYASYVNDHTKFYLCYTGTSDKLYAEVSSAVTHTSTFTPEEKYKPKDIIPRPTMQNIYSDAEILKKLGADLSSADVIKISGYMLQSEGGERFYYSYSSDITVPDIDGRLFIYATVECIYNSSSGNPKTQYLNLLVAQIVSDRGFVAAVINEIQGLFDGRPWLIVGICVVSASALGTGIFILIKHIKKKKTINKDTDENTDISPDPNTNETTEENLN